MFVDDLDGHARGGQLMHARATFLAALALATWAGHELHAADDQANTGGRMVGRCRTTSPTRTVGAFRAPFIADDCSVSAHNFPHSGSSTDSALKQISS